MGIIDWAPGLDFGKGYDNLRGEAKQQAVLGTGAAPVNAAGQTGGSNMILTQTSEDFDQAIGIDVDASAQVGLFGGGAKFGFKQRCKVSSQATFCIVSVLARNAYEQIPNPALSPEAWELLENRNTKRFRERFGDLFVSGRFVGVEFYGVVRIEASDVQKQLDIATKVQASYGFFAKGEVNVNFSESMQSSSQRIEIHTYQTGGSVQFCNSLQDMFALAQAALDEGRNGRGYPFAVMVDRYDELKLPNDNASLVEIEAARRALKRLAEHTKALTKMQNDINFVLRNQAWFESPDVARLNAASQQITREINTIVDQADLCSRDFDQCRDYAPTYPEFAMPPRKAGPPRPTLSDHEREKQRWLREEILHGGPGMMVGG